MTLGHSLSATFIETSAKTATNVNSAFLLIAKQVTKAKRLHWEGQQQEQNQPTEAIGPVYGLQGVPHTPKGKCC